MKKPKVLDNSIAFIESRLVDEISVAVIAEQAFFSKTHYQRLFRAIVGEPVMEYVKNRRLHLACREILTSDMNVINIAMKYGYDSHEGFTRAFKAYFGVPPSSYRKRGISSERSVIKMLSNEVMNRIGQNLEMLSATLNGFIGEAERLSAKSLEADANKGMGIAIVAQELRNLSGRVARFKEEDVKGLVVGDMSAFEMANRIFHVLRVLDDITFQMNLLRFFSGIETGRIAPPCERDEFDTIDDGYDKLCSHIVGKKEYMVELIHGAVELIHSDIKQEAENCVTTAIEAVENSIEDGKITASSAHAAVESLDERSRAYAHIAKRVDENIVALSNLVCDLKNTKVVSSILPLLGNSAFEMNISAFNATVETARAGNTPKCIEATKKIMRYAEVLQNTHQECESLANEYNRLIALTERNAIQSEQSIANRRVDDLMFQSSILSSQFSLEAERACHDSFSNLAQIANDNHRHFAESKDVAKYGKELESFLENLNKAVAEVGIYGGSFAYFAKEYENFMNRIG